MTARKGTQKKKQSPEASYSTTALSPSVNRQAKTTGKGKKDRARCCHSVKPENPTSAPGWIPAEQDSMWPETQPLHCQIKPLIVAGDSETMSVWDNKSEDPHKEAGCSLVCLPRQRWGNSETVPRGSLISQSNLRCEF